MELKPFDLLFLTKDGEKSIPCDDETISGLLVGEAFCRFAAGDELNYFISVAKLPLTNIENIFYRRAILNDFLDNDGLLRYMIRFINEFDDLINEQNRNTNIIKYRKQLVSLQMISTDLKQIIDVLKKYSFLFCSYKPKTAALSSILDFVKKFTSNDCNKLYDILTELENISVSSSFHMKTVLNEFGRFSHASIISIKPTAVKKEKKIFTQKKSGTNNVFDIGKCSESGIEELTNTVNSVRNGIIRLFSQLKKQLQFYSTAVKYCMFFENSNVPLCYPSFSGKQSYKELYDIFLITRNKKTVPYSFEIKNEISRTVIVGDNNSGKTVFLRCVGLCQLIAQIGLPVPAEECTIKIYNSIFYSTASTENPCGTTSRFENEVKRIASFFEKEPRGFLLLLNEVFQSTKSKEGAICLYNVLECAGSLNNDWFAVTHIKELTALYASNPETQIIRFGENYAFEQVR